MHENSIHYFGFSALAEGKLSPATPENANVLMSPVYAILEFQLDAS